ncbi:MAG: hypothetical protein MOB07_12040 [Acidobacteria bacterium]|nr:hypothetical protein [Acidobacteriota bacterium]
MNKTGHAIEHPTEEEIDKTLEETFPASDPPGWTLGIERPKAGQGGGISVDPMPESIRNRLHDLRNRLLRLHKILLDAERATWERIHGNLSGSELLNLLINHEQFAWLRNISELIVSIDETLDADQPATIEDARNLLTQARKLLKPSELGEAFAQKYLAALQHDPNVVIAHKELRELLSAEI